MKSSMYPYSRAYRSTFSTPFMASRRQHNSDDHLNYGRLSSAYINHCITVLAGGKGLTRTNGEAYQSALTRWSKRDILSLAKFRPEAVWGIVPQRLSGEQLCNGEVFSHRAPSLTEEPVTARRLLFCCGLSSALYNFRKTAKIAIYAETGHHKQKRPMASKA